MRLTSKRTSPSPFQPGGRNTDFKGGSRLISGADRVDLGLVPGSVSGTSYFSLTEHLLESQLTELHYNLTPILQVRTLRLIRNSSWLSSDPVLFLEL